MGRSYDARKLRATCIERNKKELKQRVGGNSKNEISGTPKQFSYIFSRLANVLGRESLRQSCAVQRANPGAGHIAGGAGLLKGPSGQGRTGFCGGRHLKFVEIPERAGTVGLLIERAAAWAGLQPSGPGRQKSPPTRLCPEDVTPSRRQETTMDTPTDLQRITTGCPL